MDVLPGTPTVFHVASTTIEIEHGGVKYDLSQYPPVSIAYLLTQGIQAAYGNSVSSYITEKRKQAGEAGLAAEEIEKLKAERLAYQHDRLLKGDLSTQRAPRGTRLETLMTRYAVDEITYRLKAANLSMPNKKDETVKFPDGSEFSRETLISRMLTRKGDVFKIKAEKEIARLEDEARRASERTGGGGVNSVEDLGF